VVNPWASSALADRSTRQLLKRLSRLDVLEDDAVRREEVAHLPGVDPGVAHDLGPNVGAEVDQLLDRVRDLELAPRRGRNLVDGFEEALVEHVDADDGQVGRWLGGLLDQSPRPAAFVQDEGGRRIDIKLGKWDCIACPPGVIHGFCVLSLVAQVEYKCTEVYDPKADFGVRWNDPELAVPWPIAEPVLSEKDARAPLLRDVRDRLIPFLPGPPARPHWPLPRSPLFHWLKPTGAL